MRRSDGLCLRRGLRLRLSRGFLRFLDGIGNWCPAVRGGVLGIGPRYRKENG